MKCRVSVFTITLMILTCVLAGKVELREEAWQKVMTEHFTLVGNASEKEMRSVGNRLEQFRSAISGMFDFGQRRFSPPVTVIVFKDQVSYEPYKPLYQGKPAEVSGYLHSGEDAVYITLTSDWNRQEPERTIFHEYVHFLTSGAKRPLPTWLSEGLAEYYSTFAMDRSGRRVTIGRAISSHTELLRRGELIPLKTLLTIDQDSSYYQDSDRKILFYAQSWALVHYLMTDEAGRRQNLLRQYLSALTSNQRLDSGEERFWQFFSIDPAQLEIDLRQHIRRNNFSAQAVNVEQAVKSDYSIKATPISKPEASVYLADLLWRLDRHGQAEAMLETALSQQSDLLAARVSLGLLRIRQKRYEEAREQLRYAVDAAWPDYRAHYSYAIAWQQNFVDAAGFVSDFPPEAVSEMRVSLDRARQLQPDFPDTYKALAFINLIEKENLDEAVLLLKRALELDPQREDFLYTLAQVYLKQENFAAARQTAEPLASGGLNSGIRNRANYLLESIARREEELAQAREQEERRRREHALYGHKSGEASRPPGKRFDGEQVRGLLTRIECGDDFITLTVLSGARVFRFRAEKGKLIFVRYTMEIPNEITCGAISPSRQVIVTYRPNREIRLKFDGEPVGVEFLKAETN